MLLSCPPRRSASAARDLCLVRAEAPMSCTSKPASGRSICKGSARKMRHGISVGYRGDVEKRCWRGQAKRKTGGRAGGLGGVRLGRPDSLDPSCLPCHPSAHGTLSTAEIGSATQVARLSTGRSVSSCEPSASGEEGETQGPNQGLFLPYGFLRSWTGGHATLGPPLLGG